MQPKQLPSSFRDPSGFIFREDGKIRRQVNSNYKEDYDALMSTGLYASLVEKKWLVKHEELAIDKNTICYKIIEPEQVPYISYPYEWSFSQLQDAAILTLNIQMEALMHGMTLKDASAFNVQFMNGKTIFIDTLSFEKNEEENSWVAYKQFCQHFLAPLALIAKCDYRVSHLLREYIDGIPLDLASKLLPIISWFDYSLLAHIHLHAKSQDHYKDLAGGGSLVPTKVKMNKSRQEGVILSLISAVKKQRWKYAGTEWGRYYENTNYDAESMLHKEETISRFIRSIDKSEKPTAADFGANTGRFSRLVAREGFSVLSYDIDEVAVDKNYQKIVENDEASILPLRLDLTNPSPSLGWACEERGSFMKRCQIDLGLALALVHHLAISNNTPLESIGRLFSKLCKTLIIEFVPKSDSQVIRLFATRKDIFPYYTLGNFEIAFSQYFEIIDRVEVKHSERTLYLMKVKS